MSADELNINYTREAFMNPINLGGLLLATLSAFLLSGYAYHCFWARVNVFRYCA